LALRWKREVNNAQCCSSVPAPPWEVQQSDPNHEESAATSIRTHGFVLLPGLLSRSGLAQLKEPLESRVEEVLGQLREKGVSLEVGSSAGFHEVCLRSPGRFDVPFAFESVPQEARSSFEAVAALVLGGPHTAFCGVVRAEPGSAAQLWHADSPHLCAEEAPPNMLNVMVALKDIPLEEGPTEILPGSHTLTNHLRPGAAFGSELLYQVPGNSPELIGSREAPVSAVMSAGSALIFDDRALHRGGHNVSAASRDVAFFSYRRADFQPETHYEGTRSLARYDHRGLAQGVRSEFPGLRLEAATKIPILADGASGSQLHESVIAAMVEQMKYGIANIGGSYASSEGSELAVKNARSAMADFLGCSAPEIAFGPSMTALVLHLTQALRNDSFAGPGDNIVLDPISHGSNVWSWVRLAAAVGAEVRWLPVASSDSGRSDAECFLDARVEALASVIDGRTRLVAMGAASNGVGTVHDIKAICAAAKELSGGRSLSFVDAVHFAPHSCVDVGSIGCDFLACSPYKFFGPHAGVLFGRRALMERLPAVRLDCTNNDLPEEANGHMSRWEPGTQNYEALAGVTAAVDYVAELGVRFGGADPAGATGTGATTPGGLVAGSSRRERLGAAWRAISAHEAELKERFVSGARGIPKLHLMGITDMSRLAERTATFAVGKEGLSAPEVAKRLCERGVWCTSGNHYGGYWAKQSGGLASQEEGMTRLGLLHYNTFQEVDEILTALEQI